MLSSNSVNLLIKNGFCVTDLPLLDKQTLFDGFKAFLTKEDNYKKTFLQKAYGYAFDGYSFMGQTDSSNQGYEDYVYTFVLSNFHQPDKFPVEFATFFSQEWQSLLNYIKKIEQEILAQLGYPALTQLYNQDMGHMVSCNYYPPTKALPIRNENDSRLTPHNDISLFTIFPFGLAEGLQFEDTKGNWVSIPACDTILILTGYFLAFWTKGQLKGLNHRVAMPKNSAKARTSFAFFSLPKPNRRFQLLSKKQTFTSDNYFQSYLGQFDD